MFFRKWQSLIEGSELMDAAADRKTARRIGQYRVSEQAIYRPDGSYIPFEAIEKIIQNKGTVHVNGC